jgi:DNA mismatch repair protein MutS2
LRRIKDILEVATPYSLVILDEPCGGTSYEEGCRQSLVLLDGFHQLGATTYFTTHMHPVATEIETKRFPAAKNLSVESRYDGKKLVYTYKMKEGASGKSYGDEIAKEVGLVSESIEKMLSKRADREGYADIIRK